jgi:chloramphenicol O-acetyltransferase type A
MPRTYGVKKIRKNKKLKKIDLNSWIRKQHFNHFKDFADPYFSATIPFDVTSAYKRSKDNKQGFFVTYLHDCMKAINAVDNFKYRIIEEEVYQLDLVNASPTILRADQTFGFSFIKFSEDFEEFNANFIDEKQRIMNSTELYPPLYGLDCIHCSALPWFAFSSQKEPFSGTKDSIPKLAFSKTYKQEAKLMMNVAVSVNHALVDGSHLGQFVEKFQENLNFK